MGAALHVSAVCCALGLTACLTACQLSGDGITTGDAATNDSGPAQIASVVIAGSASSGGEPLIGSTLTIYAASGAAQEPATVLAQTTVDGAGRFSATVSCPSGANPSSTLIYAIAAGGHMGTAGAADNPAIHLVSALAACDTASVSIKVNELTTVAAAYALNAFASGDQIGGSAPGLPNAVATAGLLVSPNTGEPAASLPGVPSCSTNAPPANCEALRKINALANALASCSGAASAGSAACGSLFDCATPGAVVDESGVCVPPSGSTPPADTWLAILNIARNPGTVAIPGLYSLAAKNPAYGPSPTAAPNDWTVSLNFTGGGLSEPTALAIDAAGNVWVANYNNAVTELSPTGVALSPPGGFSGGGLQESFGLAIDSAGHVWVCNEQGIAAGSVRGSVTELAADGTILSGDNGFAGGSVDFPESIAIGLDGHVWVGNFGNSTLTNLDANGAVVSAPGVYSGGGLSFPVALTVDQSGDLWIANQGADQLSEYSAAGVALSPNAGFTGGGLSVPQGIAADQGNNIWIANYYGDSVSEFNDHGIAISPNSGFSGGGIATPGGIAIDGSGRVWIAGYESGALSELTGARDVEPGAALSPPTGFKAGSLLQAFAVAIDPSGNVWVSNFGNDSVTEFIGAASPMHTPQIGFIGAASPVQTPLIGLPNAP
jgi:sugar lactone lactonase YvrE